MSNEVKIVAASIIAFLKKQLEDNSLNEDARESVEISVQCIEAAFEVTPQDATLALDLTQLVRQARGIDPELSKRAERLKNEGNELMKAERYREALDRYSSALDLVPNNAVYFCNRAAAHFKLEEHEAAVADCKAALALQPDYSKAHGRLGLALTALNRHREARASYLRASQLEPDNDSYKQNLRLAEECLAQSDERPAVDFSNLLQNPALLNMASGMLSDPNMQTLITNLMSNATASGTPTASPPGINALLEAGQMLAQQMQAANPELVEQLRRQVRPPGPNPPPAP